jgi:tRNA threonylcarbamoyladenosine biosynthesis protein TsaE
MSFELFFKTLPHEADTTALAAQIAPLLQAGDTLLLEGDIGAGKSAFARALIRNRLGRMEDVPSPTFTLVQTYETPTVDIWHCDLYRLSHPDDALELGLDDAFENAICLVEWPDRLGAAAPENALKLTFTALTNAHSVRAQGSQEWADRLHNLND